MAAPDAVANVVDGIAVAAARTLGPEELLRQIVDAGSHPFSFERYHERNRAFRELLLVAAMAYGAQDFADADWNFGSGAE